MTTDETTPAGGLGSSHGIGLAVPTRLPYFRKRSRAWHRLARMHRAGARYLEKRLAQAEEGLRLYRAARKIAMCGEKEVLWLSAMIDAWEARSREASQR